MLNDYYHGCLFMGLAPINSIIIPFLPFITLISRPRKLNEFLNFLLYFICLILTLAFSLAILIVILPLIFLKSLRFKIIRMFRSDCGKEFLKNFLKALAFMVFGVIILILNLIVDLIFFLRVCFKEEVKEIVQKYNQVFID